MPERRHESPSDTEIVGLLRQARPEGLRLLLEEYGARAVWCLRREFGSALTDGDLDEALNIAAFRAWRSARTFDGNKGTLRAWFLVIARNSVLSILRRESRQRRHVETVHGDLAGFLAGSEVAPPTDDHARFLQNLRQCIEELPPMQMSIIRADLQSGDVADATELAERLQTTKNSIYASRSIARKTLRAALAKRGFTLEPEEQPSVR